MKRLELYVGWTCNQKCTYCTEFSTMERKWNHKVTPQDILRKLLKYAQLGYNHVTFLGGEPFIQPVFFQALKIAKKLKYKILVTTNATTLHIPEQAKKFLPFIDELILSVEAIDGELQRKISRTKVEVYWDKVFQNINSYWSGSFLKANIVITQDNLLYIPELVHFAINKGISDIAITYPDIDLGYYSVDHIKEKIAPQYHECVDIVEQCIDVCKNKGVSLKLADFPLCIFPESKADAYYPMLDDYNYEARLKISSQETEWQRGVVKSVRDKVFLDGCHSCKYQGICQGIGEEYNEIYPGFEVRTLA